MASAQVVDEADRVDRDVAAPAREVVHPARDVDAVGEHGVFRTQARGQSEGRRGTVDRDHFGAQRRLRSAQR